MNDIALFAAGLGLVLGVLAVLAWIADMMGEPERWESRRRNR